MRTKVDVQVDSRKDTVPPSLCNQMNHKICAQVLFMANILSIKILFIAKIHFIHSFDNVNNIKCRCSSPSLFSVIRVDVRDLDQPVLDTCNPIDVHSDLREVALEIRDPLLDLDFRQRDVQDLENFESVKARETV